VLANDRLHPVNVCLVNVRQAPVNMHWAHDRPHSANVRTRALLNPAGALDNLIATPSLPVEGGNWPMTVIRVLGFLGFPSVYK
jgi:hypothetical protein